MTPSAPDTGRAGRTTSTDVVILGGGPAGVGAAWRLALGGHAVVLVEAAPRLGGLAASIEVAGQRVDLGSHRLHPDCRPDILGELHRLLGDDLRARPRNGRLRIAGRWVRFPLDAADLVRHAPPAFTARVVRDLGARALHRRPTAPATFADAVADRLGPTIAEEFYGPYARKLFGLPAVELSAELADRRVSATSGRRLLAKVRRPGARRPGFWYPRHGFGQLTEALADAATAAGADLRTDTAVVGIALGDDGVTIDTADGASVTARTACSTLPVAALVELVRPAPPAAVQDAAAALRSRSATVAHLVLDAPSYTPYDAHYLPDPATPVSRLSEPAHYRDELGRAPAVLCAELPGSPADDWWTASPAELGALVADGLEASGLPRPPVSEVAVHRLSHLYPVFDLGHRAHQDVVDRWLDELPHLLAFGRQALFAQDNTHHALEMAWAAASVVRPDGIARDAWRRHLSSFRMHVVAD